MAVDLDVCDFADDVLQLLVSSGGSQPSRPRKIESGVQFRTGWSSADLRRMISKLFSDISTKRSPLSKGLALNNPLLGGWTDCAGGFPPIFILFA